MLASRACCSASQTAVLSFADNTIAANLLLGEGVDVADLGVREWPRTGLTSAYVPPNSLIAVSPPLSDVSK